MPSSAVDRLRLSLSRRLSQLLLERRDLFAGPSVLLVRFSQLVAPRFQLGLQPEARLLRLARLRLPLSRHLGELLFERRDLFAGPSVLLVRLLPACCAPASSSASKRRRFFVPSPPRNRLGLSLSRRLSQLLLEHRDLFAGPSVLLVRFSQLVAPRFQLGLQPEARLLRLARLRLSLSRRLGAVAA